MMTKKIKLIENKWGFLTTGGIYDVNHDSGQFVEITDDDGYPEKIHYAGPEEFGEDIKFEWVIEDPMPVVTPQNVIYDESGSGCGIGFASYWLEEAAGEAYDELVGIQALKSESILGEHDGILDDDLFEILNKHAGTQELTGGPQAYYDFPETWVTLNDMMDYKAQHQWGPLSFHMGNITKATYRFGEKDGTSKVYDVNKIIYSGLRCKLMLEDKQSVRKYLQELLDDPQFQ